MILSSIGFCFTGFVPVVRAAMSIRNLPGEVNCLTRRRQGVFALRRLDDAPLARSSKAGKPQAPGLEDGRHAGVHAPSTVREPEEDMQ
jgi:hypothetical protein